MSAPPAIADLQAVAERALEHAVGEAQATVTWRSGRLTVEVTCVIDGRGARATATGAGNDELRRAARAAALQARRPRAWPSAGLPAPVERLPGPLPGVGLQSATVRVALASSRGVRAAWEQRYEVPAPSPVVTAPRGDPVDMPAGELPVVFGHDAVATILDHLRPAFGVELDLGSGPLHGRLGTRVAAAAIQLATPAAGFDAEGIPRTHVVLVDAGVANGRVHDTASAARSAGAATTGHATRAAALAPMPEHLRLSPGDVDGVEALWASVDRGLYVPALSAGREAEGATFRHLTRGAVLIDAAQPAAPVRDAVLRIDPLAILASVEALTTGTRTVPLARDGSADVPALLARASAG